MRHRIRSATCSTPGPSTTPRDARLPADRRSPAFRAPAQRRLLDGRIYNLESTATAVFRNSRVQTGAAVANLVTNPALVPGGSISESIVPRYQDWAGPDNYADQRWHAYTVELRHDFTDRLRVLIAPTASPSPRAAPSRPSISRSRG